MANEAFMAGFNGVMDATQKKKNKLKAGPLTTEPTSATPAASPSTYKKGGKVKKTGMAKVHKGEIVLTAREAKESRTKSSKKKKSSRKKVHSKR